MGAFAAGAFHLMTHAFFKALLFLGSGSVIHAMAGEQDMRRMGALRSYMPVTFMTMLIGTLAIAGLPPLAGFFSKDEILFRTFLDDRLIWGLAVVTAAMTAFYMFRLMAMTFFGTYRGPAWEHHAAGGAEPEEHHAAAAGGHGQGTWHGPHESPRAMTVPLIALALGAVLAGFVGVPAALGGGNAIEHFLEPSLTASVGAEAAAHGAEAAVDAASAGHEAPHMSHAGELGLMLFSVLVALGGIGLAYRFYVSRPEIADGLAERWSGPHGVLLNKYYVDEAYGASVVRGTFGSASALWTFDRRVVDGGVNGTGWLTLVSSWISHAFDKYVVDGIVNLVGWIAYESSFAFRRVQTGLIQNYALLMLFGVFAFVSYYLLVR